MNKLLDKELKLLFYDIVLLKLKVTELGKCYSQIPHFLRSIIMYQELVRDYFTG